MTSVASGVARKKKVTFSSILMKVSMVLIIAVAVYWLGLNLTNDPKQFAQVTVNGLNNGLLYALIALGYTLVYGIIELINFAHGDLFMLGAVFSFSVLTEFLGATGPSSKNYALLLVVLLLTMLFCAFINVSIERLAYRRLRNAPRLAPLITAVGMSFVLQWIGLKWIGSNPVNVNTVLPSTDFEVAGIIIAVKTLIIFAVTVPLLIVLAFIVNKTRRGRAMRATAQDKDASRLMGIDVNQTITFTFAIAGAAAGAAGIMWAQTTGTVAYNLGFQLGLIAFTSAVLGGVGNLYGAVLGGIIIGLIQSYNDGLAIGPGQRWSQTMVFTILILLMVYRPGGLLGETAQEKV
ncbi:MAG: branched-chain amino acid ABC transporter permease [Actinobacteria bacterium]|nr:branched-chain amino acid ABC transporter permease [Actinomycetota bacterium]NBO34324.1 branched-chain amino acid ABC transporter permease [Actinomycetota bacterium]